MFWETFDHEIKSTNHSLQVTTENVFERLSTHGKIIQ